MSIGPLQIVLIIVLVLILFGAGKLPKVMGDIGKGVRNMKKGLKEDEEGPKEVEGQASENTMSEDDSPNDKS